MNTRLLGIHLFLFTLMLSLNLYASDWSSARYLPPATSAKIAAPDPVYQQVFKSVDRANLLQKLQEMTGVVPVTVGGQTYSVTNRYLPASKAQFRALWMQYFAALGIPAQEMAYKTRVNIGETEGHNLEAVLPGKSKNSVVIIVHYDSIGPAGQEADNPGVDDDMSGMSTLLETARILSQYKGHLKNTVRFVAADYEEHGFPGLEGARQYAKYIKALATQEGFSVVAAIDDEQSGWNCVADGSCSDGGAPTVDAFTCSGDGNGFDFPAMGDLFSETASQYSAMQVSRGCIGENSDHYAMWEIGVPALVFSEHNPFNNPHFDQNGGDTFDKIDQNYFFQIAQLGVTYAARLVGLE